MAKALLQERREIRLSGIERKLGREDVIVSKTDLKGKITYANNVLCRVSGYSLDELVGAPHSIVRHPSMPRCIFKFLWDTIQSGNECFAYVNNLARNGDSYWVFAHITPSFDTKGEIIGYHSNRRAPSKSALEKIEPLYKFLLDIERSHSDRRVGLEKSFAALVAHLAKEQISYDEFIFSITPN